MDRLLEGDAMTGGRLPHDGRRAGMAAGAHDGQLG